LNPSVCQVVSSRRWGKKDHPFCGCGAKRKKTPGKGWILKNTGGCRGEDLRKQKNKDKRRKEGEKEKEFENNMRKPR